jgi:hypothetical protein
MRRIRNAVSVVAVAMLAVFALADHSEAQSLSIRQKKDIVRDLSTRIDDFHNRFSYQLESSSSDRRSSNEVMTDVRELQALVRAFDSQIDGRRDDRASVEDIVAAAKHVNGYMARNAQYDSLQRDWDGIQIQIDRLAGNYGVTPGWGPRRTTVANDDNYSPPNRSSGVSSPLTGTFRIDNSRSERIADVLSGSKVGASQRQELESKLEAPTEIAISVNGDQVTLASSKASPITFIADGSEKTENSGGNTVRVRATLNGDKLTVTSRGGETDYTITFQANDSGRTMNVTRRITTDYLTETVFAESVYNRTSAVAGLGIRDVAQDTGGGYSSNDPNDVYTRNPQPPVQQSGRNPRLGQPRVGEFIVPNGVVLSGTLDTEIDTKVSQNNDRFRMTVTSPSEYRGAVIEGYISGVERSGRVTGKSNVTFNFDRITLRDGSNYDFAGFLQTVTDRSGRIIAVDQEGTVSGTNQTRESVKRGGIGAGIGAIIGAIAGGGSGAAVGAAIGAGVGTGSVIAQGRGDLRVPVGAMITVQSSSPIR